MTPIQSIGARPEGATSVPAAWPLDGPRLVDALSGRHGTNRSLAGHRQIAANTDRDAMLAWLARYADSPRTLANSRKEAERLLLWTLTELGKPLSSLTHEDLLAYQRFLADPQPAQRWLMAPGRKLARHHPGWRPFAGPLSPASIRQAMVTLNSMLSWLVEAGYLAGNPLSLSRRRRRQEPPRVVRFLEEELWQEVRRTVVLMPRGTPREQATHARSRWVMSLLYLCGLRVSEVVGNTMGSFFCRPDKAGQLRWWLQVTGKGNKQRLVPATNELMAELVQYRRSLGLLELPRGGEAAPLVFPVWWRAPKRVAAAEWPEPLTRSATHCIVKEVFAQTATRLTAQDRSDQAARVRQASSHWLRHTMGSRLANDIDLRHVRDTFGHASISTTSIYLHAEDDARHAAISASHRLAWDMATLDSQDKADARSVGT